MVTVCQYRRFVTVSVWLIASVYIVLLEFGVPTAKGIVEFAYTSIRFVDAGVDNRVMMVWVWFIDALSVAPA